MKKIIFLSMALMLMGIGCQRAPASYDPPGGPRPWSQTTSSVYIDTSAIIADAQARGFVDEQGYAYVVEIIDKNGYVTDHYSAGESYEQRLVAFHPTSSERTVIADNLIQKISKAGTATYRVVLFAMPRQSGRVILWQDYGFEGFGVQYPLWSFDLKTKQLKELTTVNTKHYNSAVFVISPHQRYLAGAKDGIDTECMGDSMELLLLDLVNDTVRSLVTLPKGQTLNAAYCGNQGGGQAISWRNERTIEYSIFDQTKADLRISDPNATTINPKPLLSTKTVSI